MKVSKYGRGGKAIGNTLFSTYYVLGCLVEWVVCVAIAADLCSYAQVY
jgi:hypothetical protein